MCKLHIYSQLMRSPIPASSTASAPSNIAATGEADALMQAIAQVVRPVAHLAVAKGMPFPVAAEQLKQAFVQAAREAHPQLPLHRAVSRIATTTGLNRREVTRLTQVSSVSPKRRPIAAELFAHWSNDAAYKDRRGRPRVLPRQGAAPSFESLAQAVTRDVHPRSLLDELLRLGLAVHDLQDDTVALVRDAFVPRGDAERMLAFLGENVGDHLSAAVANVLGQGREHLEQAVFADELSAESLDQLRRLISQQWQAVTAALVPAIEDLIEQDRAAGRTQDRRLRIGLYTFTERMDGAANVDAADPSTPASAANAEST